MQKLTREQCDYLLQQLKDSRPKTINAKFTEVVCNEQLRTYRIICACTENSFPNYEKEYLRIELEDDLIALKTITNTHIFTFQAFLEFAAACNKIADWIQK